MDQDGLDELARAYVRLGLRLGRVVPELVDAHLGDPGTARAVAAEPRVDPLALRAEAEALRRHLPATGRRAEYLDAQLTACAVVAARAGGETVGFVEEVRGCLGVDVAPGDEGDYEAAHAHLADVLGVPRRRLPAAVAAFRERDRVPHGNLLAGVTTMLGALRAATAEAVGLPAGEQLDVEVVADVPWAGFSRRVGRARSVMQVARDAGHRWTHLPLLVAHEAYPGHHTETARLEGAGEPERTLLLARTPRSLVAEGAAELGLDAVVGPGWGPWATAHLAAAGLGGGTAPGALGEAVEAAMDPLAAVRQDAALLVHTSPASDREARALDHLTRWLLVDDARARRMLGFLAHPRWRIHTTTYVEGVRVVRPWLGARPAGETAGRRFARLLDEAWTPAALRREAAAASTGGRDPVFSGERYQRHADDTPMSPTA